MHSNIEKVKKHAKINLPTDYINLIESARKRRARFGVKYLDFTFFKNFKSISDVKSLKPSKGAGARYVVDIRQIKYTMGGTLLVVHYGWDTMGGTIFYNLSYDVKSWGVLHQPIKLRFLNAPQLRCSPIKISYAKWSHLQEIKRTIPKECHAFYDNLQHLPNPNGKEKIFTIV